MKQMDGIVYRILSKQAKIKKCLHWLIFHTKMYNWCWECGLKMVQKLETYVNCLGFNSESLPCQCYPLSSTEANKCLFRWRHLFEISDFLFSMIASSPFAMRTYIYIYMGQKLQDGKKVLEMSVTNLHSECCLVKTIHPTDLGLLPTWRSILRAPAQEFSHSWENF